MIPARYLSGGIDLAKFKQIMRKGTAPRVYSLQPERRRPATAAATPRAPVSPRGPAGSPRPTFYPGGIGSGGGSGSRPQSARFNQRTSFMGPNQVHRIEHRIVHIVSPLVVCPPTPQTTLSLHSPFTRPRTSTAPHPSPGGHARDLQLGAWHAHHHLQAFAL